MKQVIVDVMVSKERALGLLQKEITQFPMVSGILYQFTRLIAVAQGWRGRLSILLSKMQCSITPKTQ